MALKATLTAAEHGALDATLKTFYKADGDRFILDADGVDDLPSVRVLKSTIDKEREAARKAGIEAAQLRDKLGDLDPEEAKKALARLKELDEKAALGEIPERFKDQFEKAVAHRTESVRADFENQKKAFNKQIADKDKELGTLNSRLAELTIDNAVRTEAEKMGLHDWAIEDAVLHAGRTFKIKDGKPVPMDADGQVIFGKDANSPKPISEWLAEKAQQKPGWLKQSTGGGSQNGTGNGNVGGNSVHKIKRADARDRQKWEAAEAAAQKAGVELQIVD